MRRRTSLEDFILLLLIVLPNVVWAFDSLQGRNKELVLNWRISTKLLKSKPDERSLVLNILDSMKTLRNPLTFAFDVWENDWDHLDSSSASSYHFHPDLPVDSSSGSNSEESFENFFLGETVPIFFKIINYFPNDAQILSTVFFLLTTPPLSLTDCRMSAVTKHKIRSMLGQALPIAVQSLSEHFAKDGESDEFVRSTCNFIREAVYHHSANARNIYYEFENALEILHFYSSREKSCEVAVYNTVYHLDSTLEDDPHQHSGKSAGTDTITDLHEAFLDYDFTQARKIILEHKYDSDYLNRRYQRDWSPLHFAVESHRLDLVKLLLAAGAEPNSQKEGGWTALDIATECGDEEMVEVLVSYGANKLVSEHVEMWEERGWKSSTIREVNIQVVEEEVEKKSDQEEERRGEEHACKEEERENEKVQRQLMEESNSNHIKQSEEIGEGEKKEEVKEVKAKGKTEKEKNRRKREKEREREREMIIALRDGSSGARRKAGKSDQGSGFQGGGSHTHDSNISRGALAGKPSRLHTTVIPPEPYRFRRTTKLFHDEL